METASSLGEGGSSSISTISWTRGRWFRFWVTDGTRGIAFLHDLSVKTDENTDFGVNWDIGMCSDFPKVCGNACTRHVSGFMRIDWTKSLNSSYVMRSGQWRNGESKRLSWLCVQGIPCASKYSARSLKKTTPWESSNSLKIAGHETKKPHLPLLLPNSWTIWIQMASFKRFWVSSVKARRFEWLHVKTTEKTH